MSKPQIDQDYVKYLKEQAEMGAEWAQGDLDLYMEQFNQPEQPEQPDVPAEARWIEIMDDLVAYDSIRKELETHFEHNMHPGEQASLPQESNETFVRLRDNLKALRGF